MVFILKIKMTEKGRTLTQAEVDSATSRNILITPQCRVYVATSEKNSGKEYIGVGPGKWLGWVDVAPKATLQDVFEQNKLILDQLMLLESRLVPQ